MEAERPKAFLDLGGEPLLLRAARAFEAAPSVGRLVAVVPDAQTETARQLLAPLPKLVAVVAGGERRQDSVLAGLGQVPDGFEGVELIEAVAQQAAATGAALPVLPLVDTVKRVRGGRVVETLDRTELGGAQTPQGFRCALLREACEAARRSGLAVTDEAMAVERLGHAVYAVPGSKRNRKITTPDDLAWAEGVVAGILRA
jgi:2-C-methyl-D-erythritol 4-phosphate cytidylyltransferase